jgi:hypothetical protein
MSNVCAIYRTCYHLGTFFVVLYMPYEYIPNYSTDQQPNFVHVKVEESVIYVTAVEN